MSKRLSGSLAADLRAHGLFVRDLVLYTNSHCNLRCAHCYVGNDLLSQLFEFDAESIARTISGFDGLDRLTLLGGEVFCHSQAVEIFSLINTENITRPRLTTNLTMWDQAAIDAALSAHFQFCVSLDGGNEASHDRIRGRGTFSKVIRNLQTLGAMGAEIEITHTVSRWNQGDLWEVVNICKALGVRSLNLHLATEQGNAKIHGDMILAPSEWRAFTEQLNARASSGQGDASLAVRYPLRYVNIDEYAELLRTGEYHHHAAGSYYSSGHRAVVYVTGEIFVSSEAFGTECRIGRLESEKFVFNEGAMNELAMTASSNSFNVAEINPAIAGDRAFPIALSVSYKRNARV